MKQLICALLAAVSSIGMWCSGPVWILYCLYNLFAMSAPFWSTLGYSLLGFVVQLVVSFVLFILAGAGTIATTSANKKFTFKRK